MSGLAPDAHGSATTAAELSLQSRLVTAPHANDVNAVTDTGLIFSSESLT